MLGRDPSDRVTEDQVDEKATELAPLLNLISNIDFTVPNPKLCLLGCGRPAVTVLLVFDNEQQIDLQICTTHRNQLIDWAYRLDRLTKRDQRTAVDLTVEK